MKNIRDFQLWWTALILLTVCSVSLQAQQRSNRINFNESKLPNGLCVILVEDHSVPAISLNITYNVGSKDELKGHTGFAHLFEHLMFKGSENVADGEHFYQVLTNGGSMNGQTTNDITRYFETLPANQLELALFLEADRMKSLEITQEKLDNQRQAVQEERRSRLDNQAYGKADELIDELVYDNFAYKHSIVGSMDDLNAASVKDVADFFKLYYAPNNAVLTLIGDFKRDEALNLINKYFKSIPKQNAPPAVEIIEPKQNGERRKTVEDSLAKVPRVQIAYKTAAGNTDDFYALQILSSVLQGGQSSRLLQKLVNEKSLVSRIGGNQSEQRGTGTFNVTSYLRKPQDANEVESLIYAEIERLANEPIADWELKKAKAGARLAFTSRLQSISSRADTIGMFATFYNDPNLINTRLDKFDAVTKEDVQRVTKKYLTVANRTVVTTLPQGGNSNPKTVGVPKTMSIPKSN